MSARLDNFVPLKGRLNHRQYAGWTPTRFADSGLGCTLDADVKIAMEDGVRLSADVYRPKKTGRYPAIVQMAAYNKERHTTGMPSGTNEVGSPPVITDRGYVQVLTSRRGMGRSEGQSHAFLGEEEISDYVRAIEWAAQQPWCNGDVVLFGTSYYGMIQPYVAVRQPAALKAMFAHEVCTDMFRHLVCFGGSMNNRFFALWLGANFKDEDFTRTMDPWKRAAASHVVNRGWLWDRFVHKRVDSIYEHFQHERPSREMREWFARTIAETKSRDTMTMSEGVHRELDRIKTPFVVVQNQGQWNLHQFGPFDLFERAGTDPEDKYLIISEREYELPVLSWQLEALAFFDHAVKGCDNGYRDQPHVRYWVDGASRFEGAVSFPPPSTKKTRLFLAEGALTTAPPAGGVASWTAIPPSAPLPEGMDDVTEQEIAFRLDVDQAKTLAGPITLSIQFSCNEIDSYVVAGLSRVDRRGRRHLLSMGALRPARRAIDAELSTRYEIAIDSGVVEPLVPGRPVELRLSLVPTAARLEEGEQLLLQIASRTDRVKGKLSQGYVHFDLEEPPYFSRNHVHFGPGTYVELELA